ncbi:MAG TPA: hypothetical protein VF867_14230 [Arthrobacter sp.]
MDPRQSYVFVPQARQRDLTHWLSDDAARITPDNVTTALRSMAGNRSQYRGMAGAALGTGVSFTGLGILGWISGGGPGLLIGLSSPGLALAVLGALIFRRVRKRMPKVAGMAASRGPGNFRSGLGATAFFALIVGAMSYPLSTRLLEQGPEGFTLLVGYAVMVLVFIGSVFTVPAYFIEHAARDFRADIAASPGLRQSLEEMSLTWRDPVGAREFGPL